MRVRARFQVLLLSCPAVALALAGGWTAAAASPLAGTATEAPTPVVPPGAGEHTNPRLKLSYRQFSISNLDDTAVPLRGVQLDLYPVSMRWLRFGVEVEAGGGHASLDGASVNARYGMLGTSLGIQYPAPVTPFVEGRLVGGVLGASLKGPVTIAGSAPGSSVTIDNSSATTFIVGGGVDVGAEIFVIGRAYVSASVGWFRSTWGGVDYAAATQDPAAGLQYRSLSADSFTLKLGLGI